MTSSTYIGIDVAKAELVVATPTSFLCTVPNDDAGHGELVKRLRSIQVASVVLESTGVYGHKVAKALCQAGFPVAIVQPGRVRCFAKSCGVLAKTDAIDARMIAQFGESTRPRGCTMPEEQVTRLRALVDRRDQIIEQRKSEQNHLETCADPAIAKEVRRSIARLKKDEAAYTKRIGEHIASDDRMRRLSEALQTESGVALQTVASLLAYLPEIGSLNRQTIAALVGLAPYNRDSGEQRGKRSIYGGRRRLRKALYMAAISASRWNAWVSETYQRLLQRGKLKKVALVACGRKLAIRLNSIAAKVLKDIAAETKTA